MDLPSGYAWDENFQLGRESAALTACLWPKFLVLDSDLPEPGLTATIQPSVLKRRFPAWGIRHLASGELVAFAHGGHIWADLSSGRLPDSGWSYAIRSALTAAKTNTLCLLVANIDLKARGLGLSRHLIERAKQEAAQAGYATMIAPVRPTHKPASALVEDPWVRLHVKSGGKIVNVCAESVRVRATLPKWREWTGLSLRDSGDQVLPSGLAPLKVDLVQNIGTYIEPGVWVRY